MYLNLIQIAESFGVSEKVVEAWIRDEGLPHTLDRGRLVFDRALVVDWAAKHGLAARAGFLAPGKSAIGNGLRLGPLLRMGGIWREVPAAELPATFERIVQALPSLTPSVRQMLVQRLRAKGGVTIAPIGQGFALPHPTARISLGHHSGTVALVMLRDGLPPGETSVDDQPISRLFFFIAPSPRNHLDLLQLLSQSLTSGSLRELIISGAADADIIQAVDAIDAARTASAPSKFQK